MKNWKFWPPEHESLKERATVICVIHFASYLDLSWGRVASPQAYTFEETEEECEECKAILGALEMPELN